MRIDACFDSHVHWAATGEFAQRLRLDTLKSAADVRTLAVQPHHRRGEWILGFGWDDTDWPAPATAAALDTWQSAAPVALSRRDGHALWVNSEALRRAGLLESRVDPPGGRLRRDEHGRPTGVLLDRATEAVFDLIPPASALEMRGHLLKGTQIFNEAGFTHIRDMTADEAQWGAAVRLDESGLLTLAVESFFWARTPDHLQSAITLARRARESATPNLRPRGIKIFLDGALGSEGAWLSRCYHGTERAGLRLWTDAALADALAACWAADLEVAVHAIGDAAVDTVVRLARAHPKSGALHIEHAELVRPETIALMTGLTLTCHMQPSHWLGDHTWLESKVGDLAAHAFPWRRLQESGIALAFGSDAPIEPPSLERTFRALRESADAGVPRLLGSPATYMSHGDPSWAPNSYTLLENERPTQIVFRGEHLI